MRVVMVRYRIADGGERIGYFVRTRKGYVPIVFNPSEIHTIKNIIEEKEVDFNECTMKLE